MPSWIAVTRGRIVYHFDGEALSELSILGALNMRHFMLLGFRFELKMFKFGYAASFGMSKNE